MEYRKLGNSGFKVSEIGLGTNSFRKRVDEKTVLAIVDQAIDLGVNYIDTADTYDRGGAEEFVGKAVKGRRSQFVIATKFGKPMGSGPNTRGGSRSYIMGAAEASLRRLQTDYIDLYQFHEPDPATSLEETLRALDDLIRSGKIRYIGSSNFAAWQLCEALWTSKTHNLNAFVTEQSRYNLLDRRIEGELLDCCSAYNIGFIPWGPLAGGFLTGKYRFGKEASPEWRLAQATNVYGNIFSAANWEKLSALEKFALERGHTVGELAIAWLLAKPFVTTVIAGVREVSQVSFNTNASAWKLTGEEVAAVDAISRSGN